MPTYRFTAQLAQSFVLATAAALLSHSPVLAQATAASSSDQQLSQAAADYARSLNIPDPRKPIASRPGALTLQQVIDQARTKNLTLIAADRNLQAVKPRRSRPPSARTPIYPSTVLTSPTTRTRKTLHLRCQISRLFERGNKREYRIENARATTAQTRAQLEDTTRQTLLMVKTAFTQMLASKASLQLSTASLKEFQHEVDIAQDRYKAGDLAKIDFERLDLQLASFESDESNSIVSLRQASDQLQTLIGIETPSPDFDIAGDIVPPVLTQTREDLIKTALDKRPTTLPRSSRSTQPRPTASSSTPTGLPTRRLKRSTTAPAMKLRGLPGRHSASQLRPQPGQHQDRDLPARCLPFYRIRGPHQVISDVDQAWVNYIQSKRLSDRYNAHYLDEANDVLSIARSPSSTVALR